MASFFKHQNGMNIIGQGSNIVRTTMPFIIAAVLLNIFFPRFSALPESLDFLKTLGLILLIAGLLFWVGGLVQLLIFFPQGKLVTSGFYSVCRNPIYSSYIIFILPAVSMLTMTWVYLPAAVIMFLALRKYIKKEEEDLVGVFGKDYTDYMYRVPRTFPFFRNIHF